MRFLFIQVFFLVVSISVSQAQNDPVSTAAQSSPEAIELLDKMTDHLKGLGGLTAEFEMTIMAPGTDTVFYEGKLDQSGSKYYIDVSDYKIISDGALRWIYYRSANEANLYKADEGEDTSSPLSYLKLYESGEYIVRVADEYSGANQRSVELKPVDRMSDYIKVRLTINESNHAPGRIEVFEKGGVRTDLKIKSITSASNFPEGHFVFSEKDHPGVHLEDLRID